jgi:hypothetical protein
MWMMAAAVAMGGTTSVLQYGDYCMPPWEVDLMVFTMMMGDGSVPRCTFVCIMYLCTRYLT